MLYRSNVNIYKDDMVFRKNRQNAQKTQRDKKLVS